MRHKRVSRILKVNIVRKDGNWDSETPDRAATAGTLQVREPWRQWLGQVAHMAPEVANDHTRKWGGWAKSQSPQQKLVGSSDEEGYRSAQPKNRVFFAWELSLKKQWVRKKSIPSLGPEYRHLKLNMLNTEAALYPRLLHPNKRHCHSRSRLKMKPKTTSDDCPLPPLDPCIQSISDACGLYPQNTSCISYGSPWLPLWSEEPTTLSWTSAVTS